MYRLGWVSEKGKLESLRVKSRTISFGSVDHGGARGCFMAGCTAKKFSTGAKD